MITCLSTQITERQGTAMYYGQLGPVAETLQLKCIPQMLAVFIQYEYIYQQIYVTKTCARRAYRHPSMFKTPQMLAVDIQYKYILQNVHSPTQRVHRNPPTGIYVPTFWGIHVSWRSSVHPSGAGLGNVHFVTYIFVSDICGQHLGDVCQLEVFCAPFGRRVRECIFFL